jgi:hypothetical protein
MKKYLLTVFVLAFGLFASAQNPVTPSAPAAELQDFWPGKYVKLPAANVKEPSKLSYVTISKEGGEYRIEGFEGRKFEMSNLNRSLSELAPNPAHKAPLAHFGLGTATLRVHGVEQIVIEVFVGDDHFYLIRAEPLRAEVKAVPAPKGERSAPAK